MATDTTATPRVELVNDSTQHAMTCIQQAGSGSVAALWAESFNALFPAQVTKGAGKLHSWRNNAGTEIAALNQDGPFGFKQWMFQFLEPAGAVWSSVDGRMSATSTSAATVSGTVYEIAFPMESGVKTTNVNLFSVGAEATGTHAWCGIADSTNKVLAISADNVGAAYFPANTEVATALSAPFTSAYTGLYYAFVCVVASGTVPTWAAAPANTHVAIPTLAPIYCGSSLTAQTTPVAAGSSLGAITPLAGMQIYAYGT